MFCPDETDNSIVIRATVITAQLQMKDTIDKKLRERNAMKMKTENQRQEKRDKKSSLLSFCLVHNIKTVKQQIYENKM